MRRGARDGWWHVEKLHDVIVKGTLSLFYIMIVISDSEQRESGPGGSGGMLSVILS